MENNNEIDNTVNKIPKLKINTRSLIISKTMSGKSVLIRNLLYNLLNTYDISFIVLFSETAGLKCENEYEFIGKKNIMEYSETKLKKIMKYQDKKITKTNKNYGIIIFDDITGDSKRFPQINKLFAQSRHLNITTLAGFQYSSSGLLN